MVQFLKNYINPQGIKIPIAIHLYTAQTWLCKLGYIYKDIHKDVIVDGHEPLNIVENCANF